MNEEKLWTGLRVELKKTDNAGEIFLHRVEFLSNKLTYELSGGGPYEFTYNEAERIAVLIDAEFVLNEFLKDKIIIRKSLSGEYFKNKKEEVNE